MSCTGVQVQVLKVVIGPKPWPRSLKWSTFSDKLRALTTTGCLLTFFCLFSLGVVAATIWLLCHIGLRDAKINLQGLTILNMNLTRISTAAPTSTPWELNSDIILAFQARNPSTVAGMTNKFIYTAASVSYNGTMVAQSVIPPFSQGHRHTRTLATELNVDHYLLSEDSGAILEGEIKNDVITLDVDVEAKVIQISVGLKYRRWFNVTCSVNVSAPSVLHPGSLLSSVCYYYTTPLFATVSE